MAWSAAAVTSSRKERKGWLVGTLTSLAGARVRRTIARRHVQGGPAAAVGARHGDAGARGGLQEDAEPLDIAVGRALQQAVDGVGARGRHGAGSQERWCGDVAGRLASEAAGGSRTRSSRSSSDPSSSSSSSSGGGDGRDRRPHPHSRGDPYVNLPAGAEACVARGAGTTPLRGTIARPFLLLPPPLARVLLARRAPAGSTSACVWSSTSAGRRRRRLRCLQAPFSLWIRS